MVMPFGDKKDADGKPIDFDEIYERMIKPAVEDAGIECIRSDEIGKPGSIHRKMIEHLYKANVVVVDITTLNPNVFYELGVRHSLRRSVTVLVRRKGTSVPFNIQGFNVVEYEKGFKKVDQAKSKIGEFIKNGLAGQESDSLVHDVLPVDVKVRGKPANKSETRYLLNDASGRSLCVISGDIQDVTGIEVWVNSENTDMQMARFSDRSVSGTIRFLGAEKDDLGEVVTDTVAQELAVKKGTKTNVNPLTVIQTGSGELERTHGVKWIFHAAAVRGTPPGGGYRPVDDVHRCVRKALEKADGLVEPLKSILFPLFGTGTAQGDVGEVGLQLKAAIEYLVDTPESSLERVCFVAWSEDDLHACTRFLDSSQLVTREP